MGSSRRSRIAALALALALVGAALVERASRLPEPLFHAPQAAVLLDRNGQLLGARTARDGQWRLPHAQGSGLPPRFVAALTLAEDRRFFHHPGVDPIALLRAARSCWRAGRVVSGGSTLTMQLVRLARGNPPRTLAQKASEVLAALRLELSTSKSRILEAYAAHAPFGGNIVGLEAAAWRYFDHPAGALSWAEAAVLAVLPRSPARLHPGADRSRLRELRDALLRRLHERTELSAPELASALREPLPERPRPLPDLAPHLFETLLQRPDRPRGALHSTIDAALQRRVVERGAEHARTLAERGVNNLAALVIDHERFEVLAYLGNAPGASPMQGRDVDIAQRPRSTGSVLKPFLYAAMLEDGALLPRMLVEDVPAQYGSYRPQNFDERFRGAVPAHVALARSLNAPAARLLREYGVPRFHSLLSGMGLHTLHRAPSEYGLTLILGGAEGTLWDIAGLYANLAQLARQRGGDAAHYRRLRALGAPESHPSSKPARGSGERARIGPGAAWLTLRALLGGDELWERTAWQRFSARGSIAWKTGTSYGLRDAWAVGVSARHTIAVWAGNASGEGVPGLTGIDAAAPLLFGLFELVGAGRPLPAPRADLRSIEVCSSDGYPATPLCESRTEWVPRGSRFTRRSPFQQRVHLDPTGSWRVHAGCERLDRMRARDWFVLPPAQERYYRKLHADYAPLPPLRPDCRGAPTAGRASAPLELIYPPASAELYIPREFGGARGRAVAEAVHRRPDATLHWHLDGEYLGTTREFHRWPLLASPGAHELTVVDDRGARAQRSFSVLGAPTPLASAPPPGERDPQARALFEPPPRSPAP